MAKKRIFELARDLGMANRDLIDKLQKLGFEVKSHSSTADEEEVRKALKKADEERKAKTDERRISRGVIRRRKKDDPKAAVAAPAAPVEPTPAPVEKVEAKPEPTPAAEEAPAVETPVAEATEAETTEAVAETPAVEASAPETTETAEAVSEDQPEAVEAKAEEPPAEPKKEKREARTARPDKKRDDDDDDYEDEKPDLVVDDFGISEDDFIAAAEEKESMRIAPPPPSAPSQPKKEDDSMQPKVVRQIDPDVLKKRLAASSRPEPPKEWGKQDEPKPSVMIFDVRTDSSGKRTMVDVQKEKKKGGRTARQREQMTARDLLEHRRGQVYYPSPNRKRMKGPKGRAAKRAEPLVPVAKVPIKIGEKITVADLSQQMSMKAAQIIGFLMVNGVMVTVNQPMDHDTAVMVAEHFEYEVESQVVEEEEYLLGESMDVAKVEEDPDAVIRAPVVTVMGHVDHGKTSLLDRIRSTTVAEGEAGGITQAVSGYQVETAKGPVTFLDTPGHAAFTAMRARGANVTDIVVLVVAADDGVMPQTREAIEHARAGNVPMIVAINKIDRPEANPDRVTQQLSEMNVLLEDWGGDVLSRKVSAKTGEGVDDLLELIALQAEIMELRANPKAPAVAKVIEGHVHKGRGPVATVLIQQGTLRKGDIIVAGENVGRIRALINDQGKQIKEAGPSLPVEILGLGGVPQPGDDIRVAKDNSAAKELVARRVEERRQSELVVTKGKVSLEELIAQIQHGEQKNLRLVIKGDVQGSVEALSQALINLSTQKVRVSVVRSDVGAVSESDIEFAKASEAIIVGFGVRPDTKALKAARAMEVDVRTYKVIYEAVDEVRLAMQGLLSPVEKEKYLGRAEVRETFNVPKLGTIAGCAVVDGAISRAAQVRLLRDGRIIYDGKLSSLKRFKDDVREVKDGFECGMGIEKFNDIKIGDTIEAYEIVLQEATLDAPVIESQPAAEARP